MGTPLASTLALAALTSVALAEAPGVTTGPAAGLLQLTNSQMDQVKAGNRRGRQSCDDAVACVQNSQQNQNGDNIGGRALTIVIENGIARVVAPVRCPRAGACVRNNQQNQRGNNIGVDAVVILD